MRSSIPSNAFYSDGPLSIDAIFKALPGNYVLLLPNMPEFTICAVSDSYLQTACISKEELMEKGILKVCQEKSRPNMPIELNNLYNSLVRVITTKLADEVETIKNDLSGSEEQYCRLRNTPIINENGEISHILHAVTDITYEKKLEDEKAAQRALEESEERFRIAIEVADLATWDYNPLSGELIWNNRYKEIFGLPSNAFVDNAVFLSGLHPDDIERVEKSVVRALSPETKEKYEIEYRTIGIKDKKTRWLRARGKAFFNEKGEPYRFIGTALDITEQKQMIDALQKSELLFKSISSAAPIALFMTDKVGNTFFINETWLKWTGKSLESQLQTGWMDSVFEDDREGLITKIKESFLAQAAYNFEYRIKGPDEKVRWYMCNALPYFNKNNEFAGYAGSVTDIHERKEEELRKNDFIAMTSHELKTPLTSIKGYIQIMESKKTLDGLFATILPKAINQVNKMTKLIRDFLDLSKMESGKFSLHLGRFNLNTLVEEMIEDMQPIAERHQLIFDSCDPILVEGDKEKIGQVITNFLDNAIKYSPKAGKIHIQTKIEEHFIKLSITDQGIGIPNEFQNKIFQRFYRVQVNNNNSFSGFGIGLYLSSEIIKRHGGQIGLKSEENEGSTFYFTLPIINK